MKLSDLFPPKGIPRSGYPEGITEAWCGTDSEENYRRLGRSNQLNTVSYTYNRLGYRCPDFDTKVQTSILTVGCSHSFGIGVPQEATFGELFANRLGLELGRPVVNWNLSVPGASNDYIARILHQTVDILNPHLILIMFTHLARREYVTILDKRLHYNYSTARVVREPGLRAAYKHLEGLSSEYDDQLNFFRNFRSISRLLDSRLWYFMIRNRAEINEAVLPMGNDHEVLGFRFLDKARDELHFGPETHRHVSDAFWSRFASNRGLEAIHTSYCYDAP